LREKTHGFKIFFGCGTAKTKYTKGFNFTRFTKSCLKYSKKAWYKARLDKPHKGCPREPWGFFPEWPVPVPSVGDLSPGRDCFVLQAAQDSQRQFKENFDFAIWNTINYYDFQAGNLAFRSKSLV
jgi:hypothetical protein